MTSDPRWHTRGTGQEPRVAHRAVADIFLTKSYDEWEAILVPAGIPMGAIHAIGSRGPITLK